MERRKFAINALQPKLRQSIRSARSDMFRSLKEPEPEPDLGGANRLFALAIDGQRFEDITREEAKRQHNFE